jgi:hypothetical protein
MSRRRHDAPRSHVEFVRGAVAVDRDLALALDQPGDDMVAGEAGDEVPEVAVRRGDLAADAEVGEAADRERSFYMRRRQNTLACAIDVGEHPVGPFGVENLKRLVPAGRTASPAQPPRQRRVLTLADGQADPAVGMTEGLDARRSPSERDATDSASGIQVERDRYGSSYSLDGTTANGRPRASNHAQPRSKPSRPQGGCANDHRLRPSASISAT